MIFSLIRSRSSVILFSRTLLSSQTRKMGISENCQKMEVEIDNNLLDHFGGKKGPKFAQIATQSFYCKDSRGDAENFGAPGGDFGEFLLALDSFCALGKKEKKAGIDEIFGKWLDERCSQSRPFYLHTDRPALNRLFEAIGVGAEVRDPRYLKDALQQDRFATEFGRRADCQGCGHLRLILESTDGDKNYEIGSEIFSSVSRSFFKRFFAGDERLLFKIYENVQEGRALAVISGPISQVSLLGTQQTEEGDQVFILNQHAVSSYRRQFLVPFFTRIDDSIKESEMYERMEGKGWKNAMLTANTLAGGKPIYNMKIT